MNFAYGVIIIVGVLAAASIGFIAISPDDIIEPRIIPVEEEATVCTMQWDPMCGVDGETYGNQCMLDAEGVALDYAGECIVVKPMSEPVKEISVNSHIMFDTATVDDALVIEVEFRDDDGNIVDHVNYDISAMQGVDAILSDPGSHRHPGKHPVHETTVLGDSPVEIQVIIQGLGHGDDITEPKGIESSMTVEPEPQSEPAVVESVSEPTAEKLSSSLTISIPNGVGVPGCDDTDECYSPYDTTVNVGETVIWSNDDTAPHTVTSGTIDAGFTGVFDSRLLLTGNTFEFTFNKEGTFDYYCTIHPWMTGIIRVS